MKPYEEKNGGVDSKRQIQDQLGNDTYIAPSAIGSEENLKAKICDFETHKPEEKEILGTKETVRSCNRRRKVRIYFPS